MDIPRLMYEWGLDSLLRNEDLNLIVDASQIPFPSCPAQLRSGDDGLRMINYKTPSGKQIKVGICLGSERREIEGRANPCEECSLCPYNSEGLPK